MQKFIILIALLFIIGCSGDIDTTNMTAEQKFNIAVEKYEKGDIEDALNLLQLLELEYKGTAIHNGVIYYIGLCRFERKEYILAAYEFSKLIKNYPDSRRVVDAQFMIATCYYKLSPHYSLEQKYTKKAIEEYQAFIDNFYQDSRRAEAEQRIRELNDKLAEKMFMSAVIYTRMELTKSALIYFDAVINKYPESKFAERSFYEKVNILISKSRLKEADDTINKYLKQYPNGVYRNELSKLQTSIKSGVIVN